MFTGSSFGKKRRKRIVSSCVGDLQINKQKVIDKESFEVKINPLIHKFRLKNCIEYILYLRYGVHTRQIIKYSGDKKTYWVPHFQQVENTNEQGSSLDKLQKKQKTRLSTFFIRETFSKIISTCQKYLMKFIKKIVVCKILKFIK